MSDRRIFSHSNSKGKRLPIGHSKEDENVERTFDFHSSHNSRDHFSFKKFINKNGSEDVTKINRYYPVRASNNEVLSKQQLIVSGDLHEVENAKTKILNFSSNPVDDYHSLLFDRGYMKNEQIEELERLKMERVKPFRIKLIHERHQKLRYIPILNDSVEVRNCNSKMLASYSNFSHLVPDKELDAPRLSKQYILNVIDWQNAVRKVDRNQKVVGAWVAIALDDEIHGWCPVSDDVTVVVLKAFDEMRFINKTLYLRHCNTSKFTITCIRWLTYDIGENILFNTTNHGILQLRRLYDKCVYVLNDTEDDWDTEHFGVCIENHVAYRNFLFVGTIHGELQIYDLTTTLKLVKSKLRSENENFILQKGNGAKKIGSMVLTMNQLKLNFEPSNQWDDIGIMQMKFNEDGSNLAVAQLNGVVSIWRQDKNVQNRPELLLLWVVGTSSSRQYSGHRGPVRALQWCPWNQNLLITGGAFIDQRLCVWNVKQRKLNAHQREIGNQIRTILCAREPNEKNSNVGQILIGHGNSPAQTQHPFNMSLWELDFKIVEDHPTKKAAISANCRNSGEVVLMDDDLMKENLFTSENFYVPNIPPNFGPLRLLTKFNNGGSNVHHKSQYCSLLSNPYDWSEVLGLCDDESMRFWRPFAKRNEQTVSDKWKDLPIEQSEKSPKSKKYLKENETYVNYR
ncbi:hypothetical protein SNEBB_006571 [Seison nebaliae]|nr:hypothetical protein SNEBB_006571 [Seison nebaliae]